MTKSHSSDESGTSKRAQKKQERRLAILEALAEVVREEGIHAFSVQAVADRAGLSHRTVYRYFPSREDLLEGLVEYTETQLAPDVEGAGELTVEDLPELMTELIDHFEQIPEVVEAAAIGSLVMDIQPERRAARDRAAFEQVEELMDDDHPVSAREAGAIMRYLGNSLAWTVLRRQLGLSKEESQRALAWALETLLTDIVNPR